MKTMKMSSAPSYRAQRGHIFDVAAQGLKKHLFTAMHAFVDFKVLN
jgi:hypothetical protein